MKKQSPAINQTMTNSPGGIQAGRDVIVNPTVTRPPPRQLTAEQIGIISQELRTYGVGSVTVWEIGDPEANNFAQEFLAAIKASGWQMTLNFAGQIIPPPYGVILTVPREEAPDGAALWKALTKAGVQVEVRVQSDRKQPELLIGLRPDIPLPRIAVKALTENQPFSGIFKSEFLLTIESKATINNLFLRVDAPTIVSLNADPQRAGVSFRGNSGTREGWAFTNLQQAYGSYLIVITTKKPETFKITYHAE